MNIGEFFLSLGIKGSEKTISALGEAKKGMGELGSMSLEAKAAIIGTVYALERLMSASSQVGTNLENFNALTGISAQTLQQYQYAARQVGVSNEEMASTFKGVQNTMTSMRLGKGAPEGLAMLSGKVGFDSNRAKTDTAYVMKKLQEYANAEHEIGMRNFVLKSFGVGENVMSGMARNAFRPEVLSKAPAYSDKEIGSLDRANAAWSNLGNKIQMAIGHFNAKNGLQMVNDLSKVTDQVIKMVYAFQKLAETLHLFEALGKVFEGWSAIFEGGSKGVTAINDALKKPGGVEKLKDNVLGFFKEMPGVLQAAGEDIGSKLSLPSAYAAAPKVGNTSQSSSVQNNNVKQTFNFQSDGSDHKQVGDATQKAISHAFYQIPLGGGAK